MELRTRTLRKACIAIAILGIAFVAAPTATADCVGNTPIWWPDESCASTRLPIIQEPWHVCVSDDPVRDCI
ncbi:MAG: hypothetical protein HYT80_08385 [Euryarchaeota archaeon]|nr:hypothetical protein [Euryarchaeota archaeon]